MSGRTRAFGQGIRPRRVDRPQRLAAAQWRRAAAWLPGPVARASRGTARSTSGQPAVQGGRYIALPALVLLALALIIRGMSWPVMALRVSDSRQSSRQRSSPPSTGPASAAKDDGASVAARSGRALPETRLAFARAEPSIHRATSGQRPGTFVRASRSLASAPRPRAARSTAGARTQRRGARSTVPAATVHGPPHHTNEG